MTTDPILISCPPGATSRRQQQDTPPQPFNTKADVKHRKDLPQRAPAWQGAGMVAVMLTVSLVVRADVTRHAAVRQADLVMASDIVRSLLASADIVFDWQDCNARGECPPVPNGVVSIDVRLVPAGRPGHD